MNNTRAANEAKKAVSCGKTNAKDPLGHDRNPSDLPSGSLT